MQVPHFYGNFEIMQSHTELALLVLSGMLILGEASQGEDLCKLALQQHKKKINRQFARKIVHWNNYFVQPLTPLTQPAAGPTGPYEINRAHCLRKL